MLHFRRDIFLHTTVWPRSLVQFLFSESICTIFLHTNVCPRSPYISIKCLVDLNSLRVRQHIYIYADRGYQFRRIDCREYNTLQGIFQQRERELDIHWRVLYQKNIPNFIEQNLIFSFFLIATEKWKIALIYSRLTQLCLFCKLI